MGITGPANQSRFAYDGQGRRVQIIELTNGVAYVTNKFVWDGEMLAEQRDATGAMVTKRFFGEGEQISGVNYFFTRDHLGSVREMTDGTGAIRFRGDYDPYGRPNQIRGDLAPDFGYAGMYCHVSSGLNLTLYRTYDSDLGRWLSRDPIQELGGLNLYDYVGNDPVNGVDELGLWSPGAHDALLEFALHGVIPETDINTLQQSSRDFDEAHQSGKDSYMHSMRSKNQSIDDAIKARNNFVADTLYQARCANQSGHRDRALELLGEALHPIMDASSPMHTDDNGDPKVWNPWWPFGHSPNDSIGKETVHDITDTIYYQQRRVINNAYNMVFGQ